MATDPREATLKLLASIEHCFDRYSHCKPCAAGKTDEELRLTANAAGGDFEPMAKTARIGAFDYTENVDGTITRKDWRQP